MTFLRGIPDEATAILVECRGEDRAAMQVRAPDALHTRTRHRHHTRARVLVSGGAATACAARVRDVVW